MLWIVIPLLAVAPPDDETRMKVRKLIAELKDEKSAVDWSAAQGLGEMGPDAKEAIPALRDALKKKSSMVRGHAAAALLLVDQAEAERAFPVLRDIFKDSKDTFAHLSLLDPVGRSLIPTARATVQGLLQLAGEDVIWGWVVADMALGNVRRGNKDVIPALDAGLKDANLKVRVQAARCLGRIDKTRVKDALPVLREGLKLPDLSMRLVAAEDLLNLDESQEKHVVEALTPGLSDKDLTTRHRIAIFFFDLDGEQAEKVLPILRDGVKTAPASEGITVLQSLARTLRKKPERMKMSLPLFEDGLQVKDNDVRVETMRQVGALGPAGQAFEKQLRDASKDKRVEIALVAVEAMIRIRPDKVGDRVSQLIELAEKRDRSAHGAHKMLELLEQLKLLNPPNKEEEWGASLADQIDRRGKRLREAWTKEDLLRLKAIVELGDLGNKGNRGVKSLERLLADRESTFDLVRGQAAIALGRIGKEANLSLPVLLKVSKDEAEPLDVRAAAREALKMIDKDK
jgi:HEAT repeat protein